MRLRTWPDPVLLKPSAPVEVFDDALRAGIARMWEIMYEEKGVGLAAPQVGWPVKLLIQNPSGEAEQTDEARAIINPRVTKKWGKTLHQEGCLSFPEIFVDILRPAGVHLVWEDEQGETHEEDLDEFAARVVQHEMDHLEGVLLVHRMSPVDRIRYRYELEELKAGVKPS